MFRDPFAPGPLAATATAERCFWDAELARLRGQEDPGLWEAAAAHWKILRRPRHCAYALWRPADCLLVNGRRADAEPVIRRAAAVAVDTDQLAERINTLAHRARVELGTPAPPAPPSSPADRYALTERERQVLWLLARAVQMLRSALPCS